MTFAAISLATVLAMATLGGSDRALADPYQWSYRPVFVFAPSAGHPDLERQKAFNRASEAPYRERDIVVVSVVGARVAAALGPAPGASAADLRRRFGVARDDFSIILVGKDGGVKLRSDSPVSPERLAEVIDAMPMRQREMRRQND